MISFFFIRLNNTVPWIRMPRCNRRETTVAEVPFGVCIWHRLIGPYFIKEEDKHPVTVNHTVIEKVLLNLLWQIA